MRRKKKKKGSSCQARRGIAKVSNAVTGWERLLAAWRVEEGKGIWEGLLEKVAF